MAVVKQALISMFGGALASAIYCAIVDPETVLFAFVIVPFALPSLAVLLLAESQLPQRPILCLLIYLAASLPFTLWALYVWLISGLEGGPMAQFLLQNYLIAIVAMYASLQLFAKGMK